MSLSFNKEIEDMGSGREGIGEGWREDLCAFVLQKFNLLEIL